MTTTKPMGDLTALTEHVLGQAKERAAKTVAQAQQTAHQIIAQAEQDAKAREEELVHAGLDEVSRIRKQIISQAQLRLKEELLREKAEILGRISGEIRNRLEELCAKDGKEYLDVLVGLVQSALAGEGNPGKVVIHLSSQDCTRYKDELPQALKKELGLNQVELVPEEIHGGAIVELPERHLEVDSSLAQLLREFTPKVEALVEQEIFVPVATKEEQGEKNDGRKES